MPVTATEAAARQLFADLKPGDRVEIVHEVKVGNKLWSTTTVGTVDATERRRHGLHFRRNLDDKVFSDVIVLHRDSGEQTTVTMDEFTQIKRIS